MAESEKVAASVLAAYRNWKEEGESLKARAQGCLMDRFAELIREAQQVQHDLLEDFGQVVRFPANPKPGKKGRVRSVVRKAPPVRPVESVSATLAVPAATAASVAKPKTVPMAKSTAVPKPLVSASSSGATPTAMRNRGTTAPLRAASKPVVPRDNLDAQRLQLTRKIQKAESRLQTARDSGDPVRVQNAEDRVYELKDDLRLLTEQVG